MSLNMLLIEQSGQMVIIKDFWPTMTLIMVILVRWDESYIQPNNSANVQWTGAVDSPPPGKQVTELWVSGCDVMFSYKIMSAAHGDSCTSSYPI